MRNRYHDSKKEFQVERIAFFSDAVFAIAITLLIIEVKVPEVEQFTDSAFLQALDTELPKFFGFVLSFFLIGLFWTLHHKIFGYIVDYDNKLIWLNLIFLFSIALMPFSTSVYSEYSTPEGMQLIAPYAIYVGNICFSGMMIYVLWNYIGNPKHKLTDGSLDKETLERSKKRSLVIPSVFFLSLLISFINPILGRLSLFLIPIVMRFV